MVNRSQVGGLAAGAGYAVIYFILAFFATGAGHGTFIFFAPLGPYFLGLIFFPLAGFLADDLRPFLSRVLFISALTVHYATTAIFLRVRGVADPSYIERVWNASPWFILLPAGWYLLGQVIIWAVLIRGTFFQARRAS
jgi:hypothetical protein